MTKQTRSVLHLGKTVMNRLEIEILNSELQLA